MFSEVIIQQKTESVWIWLYQHSTHKVKLRIDYCLPFSLEVKQATECSIFVSSYVYTPEQGGELSQLSKISGQRKSDLALIIW